MFSNSAMDLLLLQARRPLTMVDIGARGGPVDQWRYLTHKARMIGFEPDLQECARLNAAGGGGMEFIATALGEHAGELDLKLAQSPAATSVYPALPAFYEKFPILEFMRPAGTELVPNSTLDREMERHGIEMVDVLKLDTQGSELDIMRGGLRTLEGCWLIDIEVEFNPLYEGQALFCNVDHFLRDQGFVLWRLENLVHYTPAIEPAGAYPMGLHAEPSPPRWIEVPNGQLFWSQAQYVRSNLPIQSDMPLTSEDAHAAAVAVGVYGFWDLVLEILRKGGERDLETALRKELAQPLSPVPY